MPTKPPALPSILRPARSAARSRRPSRTATTRPPIAAAVALAVLAAAATGCRAPDTDRSGIFEPYRIAIPQGNYLTKESLAQVREGMTPEQVRFALGTPLVQDPFRPERWDYVFRYQRANGQAVLRNATVVFRDGKVAAIEERGLPERDDPTDTALPGARGQRPLR